MRNVFDWFNRVNGMASQFESARRARDAEDYARVARQRAAWVEREQLTQAASGNLGDARLANIDDAAKAGLFDPSGLFLGAFENELLYLNADGHNLVYARAGGGKSVSFVQPNLAQYPGSFFVIDVKDGELHYSSAEHRATALGQEVVTLDPWGIRGQGSRINPLGGLDHVVAAGRRIDDEALQLARIILPPRKGDSGEHGWVRSGSRRLLVVRMKHLAYSAPGTVTLSELWRFVNSSDDEMDRALGEMSLSEHEDVAGEAKALRGSLLQAEKQFEAYRADCLDALTSFSPGSSLALATSVNDFDFADMKRRPMTVYLVVPSKKIGVAGTWLALLIEHAIEQIAGAVGPQPVRFLLDEFAQLPAPIPAVMKALNLYRGRGILLTIISQGRYALRDAGYSDEAVKQFEDQAVAISMWAVEDPSLLKDIEYWSGNASVVQLNPSHSGGQVASASYGRNEQRRPVLQVEDIRLINEGMQLLKLPGRPLFVIRRINYWEVKPWQSQLRDVRELHFGLAG